LRETSQAATLLLVALRLGELPTIMDVNWKVFEHE
jgi:hypothetical protein